MNITEYHFYDQVFCNGAKIFFFHFVHDMHIEDFSMATFINAVLRNDVISVLFKVGDILRKAFVLHKSEKYIVLLGNVLIRRQVPSLNESNECNFIVYYAYVPSTQSDHLDPS